MEHRLKCSLHEDGICRILRTASVSDKSSGWTERNLMKRILRNFMKSVVKFGMAGKHPANICLNKDGKNCHNCGGACHDGEFKKFPGYQYDFVGGDSKPEE